MDNFKILPEAIVVEIKNFLKQKKSEYKISESFVNPILRDDIFVLLEDHSIVVYYPLHDEDNYGFHVTRTLCNKKVEFVYINTKHGLSNQIFTAGHELGHIWELDKHLVDALRVNLSVDDLEERVMNRFAAELLAPQEVFINYLVKYANDIPRITQTADNSYSLEPSALMQLVVELMNQFMLPYKTIVLRLLELGVLQEELVDALLDVELRDGVLNAIVNEVIMASGYSKMINSTDVKVIKGRDVESLFDILATAEAQTVIDNTIIQSVRRDFGYAEPISANALPDFPSPSIRMNRGGKTDDN